MIEQDVFILKRSCIDQMFTLKHIMEKAIEKRKELNVISDLEKAHI